MATDPLERGEMVTDASQHPVASSSNSPDPARMAHPSVPPPDITMPKVGLVSLPAPQASSADAGNSPSQGKVKGFSAQSSGEAIPALIFAGLSAASFFTLFIVRPLESLERNTFFSWIVAIMDNYWTRLMYFQNPQTIDANLKDAISELVTELSNLADKYMAAIAKYPPLADSQTASP